VLSAYESRRDDRCIEVIDYTLKDHLERMESGQWKFSHASSISFECEDYAKCEIHTDLVVPSNIYRDDLELLESVDGCEIESVHEKRLLAEKHVHLDCNVKLSELEDTVIEIVKTRKKVLDKYI